MSAAKIAGAILAILCVFGIILGVIQNFENVIAAIGLWGFIFILLKIAQILFEPLRKYHSFSSSHSKWDVTTAEAVTPTRGADIAATVEISEAVAKRGGSANVRFSSGREFNVSIPAGTKQGARLRLTGAGNPGASGGESGDGIVSVEIASPRDDIAETVNWSSSAEAHQTKTAG